MKCELQFQRKPKSYLLLLFSSSYSFSLFVSHSVAPFLLAASYLGNKTKNATSGEAAQNKSKNENNNRSKSNETIERKCETSQRKFAKRNAK